MTTFTKADLAAKALRLPGLYGPDEAISADDQADAEDMCDALVDTLAEMDISITNGSVDAVPASWYIPLSNYIGLYLLESFGGGAPTNDQLNGAIYTMRRLCATPATGSVVEADYF
jgi:hypothetical protein